jgi:phosphoribosylamine---glycine ligase
MKILVVGSGGREHALVWSLQKSVDASVEILCAPGNAGIAQAARCIEINQTDIGALAHFAGTENVNLTIVGPESALAAGIGDEFARRGLPIVAPTRAAARLESSKAFAKDFMSRHRIPTARYEVADSIEDARDIIRRRDFGERVVVKADGLAAGKGVYVTNSPSEAESAIESLMSGEGGRRVVLEETLEGREVSLLLWTDGRDYRLMPAARDHKRIGEGDRGANTGGMGAVTAPEILGEKDLEKIVRDIVEPTLAGAEKDNLDFRGVMFIGLMLTTEGACVLEYNVRFGDPEAQAILVRLQTNFLHISEAITRRELGNIRVKWSREASACVVLAARGYPENPQTGALIEGLDGEVHNNRARIFHAGTARDEQGRWRVSGGRVLGITATGETLDHALQNCYTTIEAVRWDGMQYRRDIGKNSGQWAAGSNQ